MEYLYKEKIFKNKNGKIIFMKVANIGRSQVSKISIVMALFERIFALISGVKNVVSFELLRGR